MILLIDNYDSFTYNLEQMLREIHDDVQVIRNDQLTIDDIKRLKPEGIVLSPGPGHPEQAGLCIDVIKEFGATTPILGVCLGMQAIAAAYGGKVMHAREIVHGKSCQVHHDKTSLYVDMPQPFKAARYHSLCVEAEGLPEVLCIEGETKDKQVMAIRHKKHPIFGMQFHPESILTENGYSMLQQFVNICLKEKSPC